MTTKPSNVGLDRGIYASPFDAFTNYMNILGDFINRVNSLYPIDMDNEELNSLLTTIKNQGEEIEAKDRKIEKLQAELEKYHPSVYQSKAESAPAKESAAKKPATKKPAAKKPAAKKVPATKKSKKTPAKKK